MTIIPTSKGYCENQVEQDLACYKISTKTLAFINKVAATSHGLTTCPVLSSVYYMVYFTWLPTPTLHPPPSPSPMLSMWASVMQRKAQVPSQVMWPARVAGCSKWTHPKVPAWGSALLCSRGFSTARPQCLLMGGFPQPMRWMLRSTSCGRVEACSHERWLWFQKDLSNYITHCKAIKGNGG